MLGSTRGDAAERSASYKGPRHGVAAIYVGAGERRVTGAGSGLQYRLSPFSRYLMVDQSDIDALLRDHDIVLKP
jgi:hypothetical protein